MINRKMFSSLLMTFLLGAGLGGISPSANAASAGQSLLNSAESAKNNVTEVRYRGRGRRVHLPIGPSYIYFDYPYYYSRGYYPTHIAPRYVYDNSSYYGYGYYPGYGSRCSYSHRRCAAYWRHRNEDY
jgi:hypothetical protein